MTATTVDEASATPLLRCHECDLLQRVPSVSPGTGLRCARCGTLLFSATAGGFGRGVALYTTALVLLVIANVFPFLTLKAQGQVQPSRLLSGALDLYRNGLWEVAVAVVLFVAAVPLFKIVIGLLVLAPLAAGRRLPGAEALYRVFDRLHPWAMMEIFLLGVLVAYTKLIGLATVEIGPAALAFVALIPIVIAADAAVDPRDVWERLRPSPRVPPPVPRDDDRLVGCHTCALVSRLPATPPGRVPLCPRCGTELHRRKPDSLARTAALLTTAAILYVPANVYPVMTFASLGSGEPSTILGGVRELIAADMWPLAAIVFVASVLVPVMKLVTMSWLVYSVHRGSLRRLGERTLIYRLNELVGRWSMVDVFVVAILVALVQFGAVAEILPGVGIVAFGAVVVLTMLAALSFDPRLIWDAAATDSRSPVERIGSHG